MCSALILKERQLTSVVMHGSCRDLLRAAGFLNLSTEPLDECGGAPVSSVPMLWMVDVGVHVYRPQFLAPKTLNPKP